MGAQADYELMERRREIEADLANIEPGERSFARCPSNLTPASDHPPARGEQSMANRASACSTSLGHNA